MRVLGGVLRWSVLSVSAILTGMPTVWYVRSRDVLDRVTFGLGPTVWQVRTQHAEACVRFCPRQPAYGWGNYLFETYTPTGGYRWETFDPDPEKAANDQYAFTVWMWNDRTFYGDRCFGIDGIEVRKETTGSTTYLLFAPFWALVVAASVPWQVVGTRTLWRTTRRRRRKRSGKCVSCGYDVRASPARRPECGQPAGRNESEARAEVD